MATGCQLTVSLPAKTCPLTLSNYHHPQLYPKNWLLLSVVPAWPYWGHKTNYQQDRRRFSGCLQVTRQHFCCHASCLPSCVGGNYPWSLCAECTDGENQQHSQLPCCWEVFTIDFALTKALKIWWKKKLDMSWTESLSAVTGRRLSVLMMLSVQLISQTWAANSAAHSSRGLVISASAAI